MPKLICKLKDRESAGRKWNKNGHRRQQRRRRDDYRMENLRSDLSREESRR